MRHYFLILLMTWASMIFILLFSWALLLLNNGNLGDFTVFLPVMSALAGVAFLSKTSWFDENIRKPLAATFEFGNYIEMVIHLQFFTIICGVFGFAVAILAMTSFYPMGIKLMMKGLATGNIEWHNFTKYTPMSIVSGVGFCFLFYSYLFADACNKVWLTKVILIIGFVGSFLLGGVFGGDRYLFIISD